MCGLVVLMVSMQSAGASAPFTGSSATPTPKATSADLKIGFLESVDSLNPFQGLNDPSYLLYGLVYDYLFSFDEDGNYVPNLALSASCDAVCMNWTYQIPEPARASPSFVQESELPPGGDPYRSIPDRQHLSAAVPG